MKKIKNYVVVVPLFFSTLTAFGMERKKAWELSNVNYLIHVPTTNITFTNVPEKDKDFYADEKIKEQFKKAILSNIKAVQADDRVNTDIQITIDASQLKLLPQQLPTLLQQLATPAKVLGYTAVCLGLGYLLAQLNPTTDS